MKRRPGIRSVLVPAAFLVFWLGICFSALLRQLASPDNGDWIAVAIIVGLGGFGGYGLGKSVVRNFRRWGGDGS